jgi:diguanylate cyclase (GGDEF)-like protein
VRAFLSALDRDIERARRFDTPVGLIMLDIDDFKRVNDSYGHQQGDEVFARVAAVVRDGRASSTPRPATAGRSSR